jgi:hypothetical protein
VALKEYFKIDLETGNIQGLTPYLFDDEVDEIPNEFKLGWGGGIHLPKFNLESNYWMEGLSEEDLLNIKKLNKLDELNKTCNEVIYGKFPYVYDDGNTYFFSCDAEAQSNFDKVDRAFEKNRMTAMPWTAYDSGGNAVRLIFTKDNFEGLYVAHLNHIQGSISNFRDYLMPMVMECETEDDVNSIGWNGRPVEQEPTPEQPTEPETPETPVEESPPVEEPVEPVPVEEPEPTEPTTPTDNTEEPAPAPEEEVPIEESPPQETPIEEAPPTDTQGEDTSGTI